MSIKFFNKLELKLKASILCHLKAETNGVEEKEWHKQKHKTHALFNTALISIWLNDNFVQKQQNEMCYRLQVMTG